MFQESETASGLHFSNAAAFVDQLDKRLDNEIVSELADVRQRSERLDSSRGYHGLTLHVACETPTPRVFSDWLATG